MKTHDFFKLLVVVAVSESAGIVGSFFTAPAIRTWYPSLVKPEIAPPNWIFAPVWTTLFLLMGIAAFLIWQKGLERKDVRLALGIFGIQLLLNTLWSIIFFGQQDIGLALAEIVLLWVAILATTVAFYKISKPAAYLLLPYILWVTFAGYLNYSFWILNPEKPSGQTACTQEAKLCPDGSAVSRTGPNCEFAECPQDQP